MSRRTLTSLKPFPFEADFRVPADGPAEAPETIRLTAAELAQLGASLQAEGAASAQAKLDQVALDRIAAAEEKLARSAQTLAEVATLLDRAANPVMAGAVARRAAQDVADGQGDLFAARHAVSPAPAD
ncbi:MAG: hypothetical protein AAFR44_03020 [Pseudomonadota bacterium]